MRWNRIKSDEQQRRYLDGDEPVRAGCSDESPCVVNLDSASGFSGANPATLGRGCLLEQQRHSAQKERGAHDTLKRGLAQS